MSRKKVKEEHSETAEPVEFTVGTEVRLVLLRDGQPKNYLAYKFNEYDGQIGTIVDTASYLVDNKITFACSVQVGDRKIQLSGDCLESV